MPTLTPRDTDFIDSASTRITTVVTVNPPRRWAFTLLDANLPGIISVVEQALIEPAGDDKTVLTYVVAADVAPYMRPDRPGSQ